MPTVAEAVTELETLKHERAVWMEVVEFLSRFIDHEVSRADHKIRAEGCIQQDVPQKVVSGFIEDINEREIDPLNEKIQTLENLAVEEREDGEAEPAGKKAVKKTKPVKKVEKARVGPGGTKKGIRAVPRTAKPKSQSAS